MFLRSSLLSLLFLFGCYEPFDSPVSFPDAGRPDSGIDVGPPRPDVGFPDAGPGMESGTIETTGLPPISGGTLTVIGEQVVVADPDRDMIWVYDLSDEPRLEHGIELSAGAEPGRVVASPDEAIVVLRGLGQIAYVDLAGGVITERVDVCDAPRGVDVLESGGSVVVCAGGTVVVDDGERSRRRFVDVGLRDVIAADGVLYISILRTAEVLVVDPMTFEVVERLRPPSDEVAGVPNTAWRMRRAPAGGVLLLHQRSTEAGIEVERAGYSGSVRCESGGVVDGAVTHMEAGSPVALGPTIRMSVLTVDMALETGGGVVFASAGAEGRVRTTGVRRLAALRMESPCLDADMDGSTGGVAVTSVGVVGNKTVAWQLSGDLRVLDSIGGTFQVVHTNMPGVHDVGRDLFHQGTPSFVACASCHAEGGDDSITWNFQPTFRRTQTLRGHILETAPFHWAGDQADMAAIMQGGFVERMQGERPTDEETALLASWIDGLPELVSTAPVDAAAATHGQELFEGDAGCIDCHSGSHFTNNVSVDVGTGEALQVPSLLGISMRGPFLHDGRAATLGEALDHGETLSAAQRDAIVTYLSTL